MRQADFIYLASQSPRRRQLLEQIGVRHEPLPPGADEDVEALEHPAPDETPRAYVQRVTRAKWQAAVQRWRLRGLPQAPILCADTTVALERRILGKPADDEEALAMLRALSGRRHRVLSAVMVGWPDDPPAMRVCASQVAFDPVDDAELQAYVASAEPFGKAGAYAIQSRAAAWIPHIAGSYSGVMGLPLHDTALLLRQAGVLF